MTIGANAVLVVGKISRGHMSQVCDPSLTSKFVFGRLFSEKCYS